MVSFELREQGEGMLGHATGRAGRLLHLVQRAAVPRGHRGPLERNARRDLARHEGARQPARREGHLRTARAENRFAFAHYCWMMLLFLFYSYILLLLAFFLTRSLRLCLCRRLVLLEPRDPVGEHRARTRGHGASRAARLSRSQALRN